VLGQITDQQQIQASSEDFHAKNCCAVWQKLLIYALLFKIFLPRGMEITFPRPVIVQGYGHEFLYRKRWVRQKEHQAHKQSWFTGLWTSFWAGSHGAISPISGGIALHIYLYYILFLNGI